MNLMCARTTSEQETSQLALAKEAGVAQTINLIKWQVQSISGFCLKLAYEAETDLNVFTLGRPNCMNQPHKHRNLAGRTESACLWVQNLDGEYRMAEINKIVKAIWSYNHLLLANVAAYFLWYFQPRMGF